MVALFDRLNPDDKTQLLAPILARDLPTAGSGYIYARQHEPRPRIRSWPDYVCHRQQEKRWSRPVKAFSRER